MLPGPTIAAGTLRGVSVTALTVTSYRENVVAMCSAVRNEPAISMLDRSAMLLLAFRPSGGGMTLAELCRSTGIPKATAHRLVAELVKWGLLERSGQRLRLGVRVFELGQLGPRERHIGE